MAGSGIKSDQSSFNWMVAIDDESLQLTDLIARGDGETDIAVLKHFETIVIDRSSAGFDLRGEETVNAAETKTEMAIQSGFAEAARRCVRPAR